jgi:GT2 family glycosyltransferase
MIAGLTVIVVSKGLDAMLAACLEHVGRAVGTCEGLSRFTFVVVDNASPHPYLPEQFPKTTVQLLRYDQPQSFARANNAAAARWPDDAYLLLNNDVLLAEGALASMCGVLERDPHAGICGTRLLFPDGTIQHCGVGFGAGERGPYHCHRGRRSSLVPRTTSEWQAVTGACLLVRRAVWDEAGGLDEAYPFGLEDIDLCLRARQRGWRVLCVNDTDSLHFESMTPGRVALDVPSRRLFMTRWKDRYTIDA